MPRACPVETYVCRYATNRTANPMPRVCPVDGYVCRYGGMGVGERGVGAVGSSQRNAPPGKPVAWESEA
jgi:hypothetical protein